jgi:hypothetical protein
MRKIAVVFASLAFALIAGATPGRAERIFGLTTSNQIFSFDSASPGTILGPISVAGLTAGGILVGIDSRPATPGVLVGVERLANGSGAVYTINPTTGAATQINTIPALDGTAYGVDFNPVPNALRIVSNADQNLRIVNGGAGAVNVDSTLNPGDPSVVGAAYSNNQPGGLNGQTTLYDIDSVLDQLFTQGSVNFPPGISPNTGTLFLVGSLGVNTSDLVGFDISGSSGVAFASLTPATGAGSSLYTINLATGSATLVGSIGDGFLFVQDVSVVTTAVPQPATLGLFLAGALALGVMAARGGRIWARLTCRAPAR